MRKFIIAIALMIGVMFTIGHFAELQAIVEILRQGDFRFIGLAIFVEMLWLINIAATFRAIFRALSIKEDLKQLIYLATAANFVNVVAPTGGISGLAVVLAAAKSRGYSSGRATVASALLILNEHIGLLTVLAIGLIVMFRRDNLNTPVLIASMILIALALTIALLLLLGMRSASKLERVLTWIARQVNWISVRVIKRDYLPEDQAAEFAQETAKGLEILRHKPKKLILPITLGLTSKGLLIIIFILMFLAFKVPYSPGTIIAGFSIGQLFHIVSPTPAGVGVVEGALTLVLNSLYVPLSSAAVITIAYRGVTFWLPLLLGFITFRRIGLDYDQASSPHEVPENSKLIPPSEINLNPENKELIRMGEREIR
jgi:uncharacterized protein (TIRG00374 family)